MKLALRIFIESFICCPHPLLFAFPHHNIKHLLVGFVHGVGTDADKVAYALVYVVVDDAFDATYAVALHG